jgi:hypothetical protein
MKAIKGKRPFFRKTAYDQYRQPNHQAGLAPYGPLRQAHLRCSQGFSVTLKWVLPNLTTWLPSMRLIFETTDYNHNARTEHGRRSAELRLRLLSGLGTSPPLPVRGSERTPRCPPTPALAPPRPLPSSLSR